eukprot:2919430-Prymnesium_polylepis.2
MSGMDDVNRTRVLLVTALGILCVNSARSAHKGESPLVTPETRMAHKARARRAVLRARGAPCATRCVRAETDESSPPRASTRRVNGARLTIQ